MTPLGQRFFGDFGNGAPVLHGVEAVVTREQAQGFTRADRPAVPAIANRVDKLWPDSTIVCLATGPSLTQADVDACRGRARVIAIKDAVRMAPWADVLYGCGQDHSRWWQRNGPTLTFEGLKFTMDPKAAEWATVLEVTGELGLEEQPTGLRTGRNSGYQAINLAVHLGARRIVLLGFDMQPDREDRDHFFGAHPTKNRPPFPLFLQCFHTLVEPLERFGVQVINATRETALETFPRRSLEEALS